MKTDIIKLILAGEDMLDTCHEPNARNDWQSQVEEIRTKNNITDQDIAQVRNQIQEEAYNISKINWEKIEADKKNRDKEILKEFGL